MVEPLPPLKPIPIKDRLSVLYIEKGHLDVLDGAFVVVDKTGIRTHIPVGGVACLMLEPGTRVSYTPSGPRRSEACGLQGGFPPAAEMDSQTNIYARSITPSKNRLARLPWCDATTSLKLDGVRTENGPFGRFPQRDDAASLKIVHTTSECFHL